MSDPKGPWQDYGDTNHGETASPRHLSGGRRPVPPDGYGTPTHRDDDHDDSAGWSVRAAFSAVAGRYRSAPLWARVTTDIGAASLVMALALVVAVSVAVRQDGGPELASVAEPAATTSTTSTTVATTTTVPATTTVPTTTTTVATTTTEPPAAPPPTEPPPPPTTEAPPTTEPVHYDDCREAFFAGALPLHEGEPGYGPHLDRDGDGEACEWDDRDDRDRDWN